MVRMGLTCRRGCTFGGSAGLTIGRVQQLFGVTGLFIPLERILLLAKSLVRLVV